MGRAQRGGVAAVSGKSRAAQPRTAARPAAASRASHRLIFEEQLLEKAKDHSPERSAVGLVADAMEALASRAERRPSEMTRWAVRDLITDLVPTEPVDEVACQLEIMFGQPHDTWT